jgi:hypothetical protein
MPIPNLAEHLLIAVVGIIVGIITIISGFITFVIAAYFCPDWIAKLIAIALGGVSFWIIVGGTGIFRELLQRRREWKSDSIVSATATKLSPIEGIALYGFAVSGAATILYFWFSINLKVG